MTPITAQVLAFIRKRENQFRMVMRDGRTVPHYARKVKAIVDVRRTMEGAAGYSITGQAWAVIHHEADIRYIMPSVDSRFSSMRNSMIGLIDYCYEQVHTTTNEHNGATINHLPG